ncbi:hypothetical protein IAT38_004959 [Cryptococcus sp. DSM 104549]
MPPLLPQPSRPGPQEPSVADVIQSTPLQRPKAFQLMTSGLSPLSQRAKKPPFSSLSSLSSAAQLAVRSTAAAPAVTLQ